MTGKQACVSSRPITSKYKNGAEVRAALRERTVKPSRPSPRLRGLRRPQVKDGVAVINPLVFEDKLTGQRIEVRVSPQYSTIHVGERVYYFVRETGEFDGTSCPMRDD